MMCACQDETSTIGNTLSAGEVTINIDSLTFNLHTQPIEVSNFDSRSGNLLLGNLETDEYGALNCSFVTRFMCVPKLNIPDSLFYSERVDSCKLMMQVPRGSLTGDSVAPQKLTVYPLNRQLPSDITNSFDPSGYYDPSDILGAKSYTLSNIALRDSDFYQATFVPIDIKLPKEMGSDIFEKYKNDPETFQWPQTFAQYFPGVFVKQTFGKGCVANINRLYVSVYYHHLEDKTYIEGTDTIRKQIHVADSVIPFIVSPEVLSSNNIKYTVSDRIKSLIAEEKTIITTPGGYNATFNFPVSDLIDLYYSKGAHLATVNDLILSIPATPVDNSFGLAPAPTMLLIKTSEMEEFFAGNKVPDNKIAFTATYDSTNQVYNFSSMRTYIIDMIAKGEISEDDTNFTLMPVDVTTETVSGYSSSASYVTKCVPYTAKPTMTLMNAEEALIIFSFSSQMID